MNGILIDEFGDFLISNGSIAIGDVNDQICAFVMVAAPNEFKEVPTLGMNIKSMQGGIVDHTFVGKAKAQLQTQKLKAKKFTITTEDIYVEV